MFINGKLKAIYKLGNMKLKGHIDCYCDDGTFSFITEEDEIKGNRPILVSAQDVIVVLK